MIILAALRGIAEIEFSGLVSQTETLGAKLRVFLTDRSYIDVWASQRISGRYGFHWERRHIDGRIYRLDNFPDTNWHEVASFPLHFHDGTEARVVTSPFEHGTEPAFRGFMAFVKATMAGVSGPSST